MLFSPKEQFQIYNIFKYIFEINNVTLYLIFIKIIFIILNKLLNNLIISNWWNYLNESFYHTILLKVKNYINKNNIILFPLIFSIFFFILFSNLFGKIPYSTTCTVEIIITLFISFTLLIGLLITSFLMKNFLLFALFLPAGTPNKLIILKVPLELLAYFTKIASLGLRLAVNLITGHILTKVSINFIWLSFLNNMNIIYLILPLLLISLFLSLELLIAYLQAYIFTFILCITIKDLLE